MTQKNNLLLYYFSLLLSVSLNLNLPLLLKLFVFTFRVWNCHQFGSNRVFMKNHFKVSSKMDVIYVSKYIQYLHKNQTIASEYVIRISHFTREKLAYVSSFTNMFYNNHIWEQIYCFLQFPGGSCKPRTVGSHWSFVFSEGLDSAFYGGVFNPFADGWLTAEPGWCSCRGSERCLGLYSPVEDGN